MFRGFCHDKRAVLLFMSGNPNLLFSLRGLYIKRKNNSRRPRHWFASAYVTPTCAPAVAAWDFDEETEGQLEGGGAVRTITVKEA